MSTIAPLPLAGEGLTHIEGYGSDLGFDFDFGFDFKSPAAAPSIADEAGVFGEDCLSEASSAAARFGEKHRKQAAGGVFLFGYFILDKQNKVLRLEAKKSTTLDLRCANKHQFARPTCYAGLCFKISVYMVT